MYVSYGASKHDWVALLSLFPVLRNLGKVCSASHLGWGALPEPPSVISTLSPFQILLFHASLYTLCTPVLRTAHIKTGARTPGQLVACWSHTWRCLLPATHQCSTADITRCEWPGQAHLQFCRPRDPHKFCVAPSPQHGAHTEPHAGTQLGLQLEKAHLWHEPPALHASLQAPAARQADEVCRPPGLAYSAECASATTACHAGICSKMRNCTALKAASGGPCRISVLAGRMLSPPKAGQQHICLLLVQGPVEQCPRHCQQCCICRRPSALGYGPCQRPPVCQIRFGATAQAALAQLVCQACLPAHIGSQYRRSRACAAQPAQRWHRRQSPSFKACSRPR